MSVYALSMPAKAWLGQALISCAFAVGGGAPPWSWADFKPHARIFAPRLGVSVVALSSSSGEAMAWGPGHVEGSAETSANGTVAYAGHRDSHFRFLGQLRLEDGVLVEQASATTAAYQVAQRIVVDSRSWRLPVEDAERLALTTCWPIGVSTPGPMRPVILADRVLPIHPSIRLEAHLARRDWLNLHGQAAGGVRSRFLRGLKSAKKHSR